MGIKDFLAKIISHQIYKIRARLDLDQIEINRLNKIIVERKRGKK